MEWAKKLNLAGKRFAIVSKEYFCTLCGSEIDKHGLSDKKNAYM